MDDLLQLSSPGYIAVNPHPLSEESGVLSYSTGYPVNAFMYRPCEWDLGTQNVRAYIDPLVPLIQDEMPLMAFHFWV